MRDSGGRAAKLRANPNSTIPNCNSLRARFGDEYCGGGWFVVRISASRVKKNTTMTAAANLEEEETHSDNIKQLAAAAAADKIHIHVIHSCHQRLTI